MTLTVTTGLQAGQLAQAIQLINQQIAILQSAINNNLTISAINVLAQAADGSQTNLQANLPMDATDSATLFNNVLSLYQAKLTALTTQLQAIS